MCGVVGENATLIKTPRGGKPMKHKPEISDAEYQVMKVIWSASLPISTNQVVEKLEPYTAWKPKTIHTLLSRLVKKGALQYEKDGRVFVYTPLVKESEILAAENDNFLNRFYGGALNSMVVNLLEEDKLSDDDIAMLRRILDKKHAARPMSPEVG